MAEAGSEVQGSREKSLPPASSMRRSSASKHPGRWTLRFVEPDGWASGFGVVRRRGVRDRGSQCIWGARGRTGRPRSKGNVLPSCGRPGRVSVRCEVLLSEIRSGRKEEKVYHCELEPAALAVERRVIGEGGAEEPVAVSKAVPGMDVRLGAWAMSSLVWRVQNRTHWTIPTQKNKYRFE